MGLNKKFYKIVKLENSDFVLQSNIFKYLKIACHDILYTD